MGFVRSKEEIARIQEALHKPRFVNAEMLTVDFLDPGMNAADPKSRRNGAADAPPEANAIEQHAATSNLFTSLFILITPF